MPPAEDFVLSRAPSEPDRLPTLTEVVQLANDPWAAAAPAACGRAVCALQETPQEEQPVEDRAAVLSQTDTAETGPAASAPDEQEVTRRVLAALAQRLDGLFEQRLREALAPALARAADGLIRDLRAELTQALHELVHDAVQRAIQDTPPR